MRYVRRVNPTKIEVVYLSADGLRYRPTEKADRLSSSIRDRFGVRGRYLLTLGAVDPRKNTARVVRAFDAAFADQPDDDRISLLIVGIDSLSTSISSLFESVGYESCQINACRTSPEKK